MTGRTRVVDGANDREDPARAAAGGRDVPDGFRVGFVSIMLVVLWVRSPFHDLAATANLEASNGGTVGNQVTFGLVGLAAALLVQRIGRSALLRPLTTAPVLLLAAWFTLTVATSVEPSLSVRRAILLAVTLLASAAIPAAARSPRQFSGILAATALTVLAGCYLAVALVPDLATHTAVDLREQEHAGAWRGLFPHKNAAGAMMAVFALIGIYAFGAGHRLLGAALVALSVVFLGFTASRTSAAVLPLVLATSSLAAALRSTTGRVIVLLGPLLVLLTASLGSLFLPPVKDVLSTILPDVSFTGRTDLWEFAVDHVREKPIFGWGFGAFWDSDRIRFAGSEVLTWVNTADQAHNGYLDILLIMGFPGLALILVAFVVAPFRDFQATARRAGIDASGMFFLRLWQFGLIIACLESILLDANDATFAMFAMAIVGLRLLAVYGPAPEIDHSARPLRDRPPVGNSAVPRTGS